MLYLSIFFSGYIVLATKIYLLFAVMRFSAILFRLFVASTVRTVSAATSATAPFSVFYGEKRRKKDDDRNRGDYNVVERFHTNKLPTKKTAKLAA